LSAGTLYVAIKGDTKDLIKALKSAKAESITYGRQAKKSFDPVNSALVSMRKSVIALGAAWAGVNGLTVLKRVTDQYTLIDSKLKLVTKSSQEFSKTYERLYKIAQDTGQNFEENAMAFTNMSIALRGTGVSLSDQLEIFETFNKALIINGSTTREAAAATLQFKQAMATGILAGEEFRGVSEGNAYYANQLEKALGLATGQLREYSRAQKLTREEIIRGTKAMKEQVEGDFGGITKILQRGINEVANSVKLIIAQANKSAQGTSKLSESLSDLSKTIAENKDAYASVFSGMSESSAILLTDIGKVAQAVIDFAGAVIEANKFITDNVGGGPSALEWGIFGALLFKGKTGYGLIMLALASLQKESSRIMSAMIAEANREGGSRSGVALLIEHIFGKPGEAKNSARAISDTIDKLEERIKAIKPAKFFPDPIADEKDRQRLQKEIEYWADMLYEATTPPDDFYRIDADLPSDMSGPPKDRVTISSPENEVYDYYKQKLREQEKSTKDTTTKVTELYTNMWDDIASTDERSTDAYLANEEAKLALSKKITDEIKHLTLDETEYKKWALDQQVADMRLTAGVDKALQDEITEYHKLKLDEIAEATESATDSMTDSWSSFNDEVKGTLEDTLSSAFKGEFDSIEDAWDSMLDSMASALADKMAELTVDEIFSDSGSSDSSWLGSLGDTISSWFDWHTGGQITAAGTKGYAPGGLLTGGSGMRDDLYLGRVGNNHILAMGGEYIVNKEATSNNLGLLRDINAGRVKGYADGGMPQTGNRVNTLQNYDMEHFLDVMKVKNSWLLTGIAAALNMPSYLTATMMELVVDAVQAGINSIELASVVDALEAIDADIEMGLATMDYMAENQISPTDIDSLADSIDASVNTGLESQAQSLTAALNAIDADIARSLASQNSEAYNANSFALPGSSDSNEHYFGLSSSWYSNMYGSTDDGMSSADVGSVGDHSSDDTHAAGGVIDSVYLSDSMPGTGVDDGWAKVSMGEGVIDADTMKILSSKIRNGELGGGNTVVKVYLGDKEIKRLVDDVVVTRGRQNVNSASRLYI